MIQRGGSVSEVGGGVAVVITLPASLLLIIPFLNVCRHRNMLHTGNLPVMVLFTWSLLSGMERTGPLGFVVKSQGTRDGESAVY